MQLHKITAPSLKELFVREIENKILSGEIQIGEALPSERDMAEQMGVSRAVITAGLSELAAKGFIEIKPRSGSVVADYHRKGSVDTLVSIMNYNGGTLQQNEIRSIIEIRLAVEKIMLRKFIPVATEEDLHTLETLLERLKNSNGVQETTDNTFTFHHELTVLSGNTLLPLIYYSFRIPISSLWSRYCRLYGTSALYDNAKTLFEYIKARDVEGAVHWSEKYINASISGDREIYAD